MAGLIGQVERLLVLGHRWEETVEQVLQPVEVLIYAGEPDYQGSATTLVRRADGTLVAYEWSYGSCSGCDPWEDEPEEKVLGEIASSLNVMSADTAANYVEMLTKGNDSRWRSERIPAEMLAAALDRCIELAREDLAAERARGAAINDLFHAVRELKD